MRSKGILLLLGVALVAIGLAIPMASLMTELARDYRYGGVIIDSRGLTQSITGECSPAIIGVGGSVVIACKQAPNPTSAVPSSVDSELAKLVAGSVAFNAPDQAIIGKSQVIEARLSSSVLPSKLISELPGSGNKESAPLQVGKKMAATLNGGSGFDVSPSGPQIQFISSKDTTVWAWTVTAKTAGTQFLILSFDALLTIDGKEGSRNVNTLVKKIEVQVGWPETARDWLDYGKGLFEGLNWFWATILVPIGAYVIHLWKKKRGSDSSSARQDPSNAA
jgi:hypothetical protein